MIILREISTEQVQVTTDTPVPTISSTGDISFYTSRIDKIFLLSDGRFDISTGTPSLSPTKPKAIDDSIEMFELFIPATLNT